MRRLSARVLLALGLVCILVSVMCFTAYLGILPDPVAAARRGRADLCETVALNSSLYVSRGEVPRLEQVLTALAEHNDQIESIGVRRKDGRLIVEVGDHASQWKGVADNASSETHVHVPLYAGKAKWGTVEMRFCPLTRAGLVGMLSSPWVKFVALVGGVCAILFYIYLRRMLQHLDPSKTVPKRVRAALDTLAEGLMVLDQRGRIVLANSAFGELVGKEPEQIVGNYASGLKWQVDGGRRGKKEKLPWQLSMEQRVPSLGCVVGLVDRHEQTRTLIANCSPVFGHKADCRGVFVSFEDVTQLEETKQQLSKSKEEAELANRAKSDFLACMSHEIRTPMNAILGYTDVLRRGFDKSVEDRQEYLDTIHSSGEHLLALINDILDLSKIESGRMDLELDRCSPHKVISQVVSLLQAKADEKSIALKCEYDGPLPESILSDAVRLRQTIVNLAGNAIKFTDRGSVRIVARLLGKEMLQIDVIDTGIGISEDAQKRIFDPFAQADTSITRRFGGTGLGLAISKQLAEALGGELTVQSQVGRGSTFSVTISTGPLDGVRLVDAKTALAKSPQQAAESESIAQLSPARVLVADDGESNRKLIQLVLGRAGATVVGAENGLQAVELARRESFDVILMDMQMPVMDGYTATTTLRQAGYERPIIALTAHAMQGDEEKCLAAGCSGFMTKPINIDRLLGTMSELLADVNDAGNAAPLGADQQVDDIESAVDELTTLAGELAQSEESAIESAVLDEPAAEKPETSSDAAAALSPIVSSLPLDDAEFFEIVQEFVERLHERLAEMREASARGDHDEVAKLAHWLKGCGGTAGFDDFTAPARTLEELAHQGESDRILAAIDDLQQLADRIDISTPV